MAFFVFRKGFIMLEKYYEQKIKYKDYVIFIKCGNFYEVFENDALIINDLFGYKIKRFSNTFKAGFPVSKLDDITFKLNDLKVNYLVINPCDNIVGKFNDNTYHKYKFNIDKIRLNFFKLDKIIAYINNHILDDNMAEILNEMEVLL